MDCGHLSDPANGKVTSTGTMLGSIAAYSCNSGYGKLSESPIICQDNGNWSGIATCLGGSNDSILLTFKIPYSQMIVGLFQILLMGMLCGVVQYLGL